MGDALVDAECVGDDASSGGPILAIASAIRGTMRTVTAAAATPVRAKVFISRMGSGQWCNLQKLPVAKRNIVELRQALAPDGFEFACKPEEPMSPDAVDCQ